MNVAIRCSSCRRQIGVAESETALRNSVYCDELCKEELPVTPNEARNDQWDALVSFGWSPVMVGKIYGVAHSQVYKAIARSSAKR